MKTAVVFLVLFLVGCSKPTELSTNPAAIANAGVTDKDVSLLGVRLGDPASAIPDDQIIETRDNGIRALKGERAIRVADGKVVQLILLSQADLSAFNIGTEAQIEKVFGKADRMMDETLSSSPIHVYFYESKRLAVTWADSFGPVSIGDRLK